MKVTHGEFRNICRQLGVLLTYQSKRVDVGEWQAMDVSDKPMLVTWEYPHVTLHCAMPESVEAMQAIVQPNLPWAEEHFLERVGGEPLNPPPSHIRWPFAQRGNEEHTDSGVFSHTYPERFWPKLANGGAIATNHILPPHHTLPHRGVRYQYGDLQDVVDQLHRNPLTRQAYLPVFFPEDTGAVSGQRVPCTLGYHFLIRDGLIDIDYHIRSCDYLRHFRDDVYMAMRLALWVKEKLREREPELHQFGLGLLVMHIGSLHVFDGDWPRMRREFS